MTSLIKPNHQHDQADEAPDQKAQHFQQAVEAVSIAAHSTLVIASLRHGVMESLRHCVIASLRHCVIASWSHGVMESWSHGVAMLHLSGQARSGKSGTAAGSAGGPQEPYQTCMSNEADWRQNTERHRVMSTGAGKKVLSQ